jgi:hypothetical protein
MKALRYAAPAVLALLTACAGWRWSGSPPKDGRPATAALHGLENEEKMHPAPPVDMHAEDEAAVRLSTTPAETPRAVVPPTPQQRYRTALFYSDLGPDEVDVSAYPTQQRYNYAIYARSCGRCHTLARSINAPLVGRGWWEFYMLGMRVRSRRTGRPLPPDEVKAILDFLEYDSHERKVEHARDFDQLTEELKERFDRSIAERMRAMQKANPRPLAPPKP